MPLSNVVDAVYRFYNSVIRVEWAGVDPKVRGAFIPYASDI